MKFIGLDIASVTGYAFIASSRSGVTSHWELGTCRADSKQKHDVLAFAKEHGVTHAILEQPVPMRGGKGGNHATTQITMGRSMGRWEEACDMAGLIVVPVWVASWQAAMLVMNGRKMDNADKAASIAIAKTLGAYPRNGDEADAVCLCAYGPTAVVRQAEKVEEKRQARNAKARARSRK